MNIDFVNEISYIAGCVEDAEELLRFVWERWFGMRDQKPIREYDASAIGLIIKLVCDRLFEAVGMARLRIGEDGRAANYFLELADAYRAAKRGE